MCPGADMFRKGGGFLKVPARPGTIDAVSHVNLELEPDVELCSQVALAAAAI